MDSIDLADGDNTKRSFPRVYGATFIGGADNYKQSTKENPLMIIRERSGGEFGNMILSHGLQYGVKLVRSLAPIPKPHVPCAIVFRDAALCATIT